MSLRLYQNWMMCVFFLEYRLHIGLTGWYIRSSIHYTEVRCLEFEYFSMSLTAKLCSFVFVRSGSQILKLLAIQLLASSTTWAAQVSTILCSSVQTVLCNIFATMVNAYWFLYYFCNYGQCILFSVICLHLQRNYV